MMGLPEGHVTGHGLRPAQALKMLGNGVVPAQAALALRLLLGLPAPKAGDEERGRDLPRMRPDEKSRELSTAVAFMGDEDGAE